MKFSEAWLREWVNPPIDSTALTHQLTMAGLEVEEIFTLSHLSEARIAEVIVNDEQKNRLVCKLTKDEEAVIHFPYHPSLSVGMKVAIHNHQLCHLAMMGLGDETDIFIVSPHAEIGALLSEYYLTNDTIITINVTPNRGDCLSIKGIAREVSAITGAPLNEPTIEIWPAEIQKELPITVYAESACPLYAGRIIHNVDLSIPTPLWLEERLRRSDIRSINIVVDIMNYVMLLLGQPMHAFDLDKIVGGIHVRLAKDNEKLILLDGTEQTLIPQSLIIADLHKPLALAGIMGGLESAVTPQTKNIFIESAFFDPLTISRYRQQYQIHTDSAYRFERGVDPKLAQIALEYATQLIVKLAGGTPALSQTVSAERYLKKQNKIVLKPEQIEKTLGITIERQSVENIFIALGFDYVWQDKEWQVLSPSFRFDIAIPEDLIEEIARIYGYNQIPVAKFSGSEPFQLSNENDANLTQLRQFLSNRGYHEVITYSFIDESLQKLLDKPSNLSPLVNPMTSEMSTMRTNLWPGLLTTFLYNHSRQQQRIRLFEIGNCFSSSDNAVNESLKVGGLISGALLPLQWGEKPRNCDFFDIKGDVAEMLLLFGLKNVHYEACDHPALHPGQAAYVRQGEHIIGSLGSVHPVILQKLDIPISLFVFELDFAFLQKKPLLKVEEPSRFPEIRRDISLLVKESIPAAKIQDKIKEIGGLLLKDVYIFDLFQGGNVPDGMKSIALALILQHATRTLVDEEVNELLKSVTRELKEQLGAELRS